MCDRMMYVLDTLYIHSITNEVYIYDINQTIKGDVLTSENNWKVLKNFVR